jgi:hypothetical protein
MLWLGSACPCSSVLHIEAWPIVCRCFCLVDCEIRTSRIVGQGFVNPFDLMALFGCELQKLNVKGRIRFVVEQKHNGRHWTVRRV